MAATVVGEHVLWGDQGPETRPAAPPTRRPAVGLRAGAYGPRRMTDEQETGMLEFLKQQRPEQYARLMKLKETSPDRYRWAAQGMWRWYRRWQRMSEEERAEENARREIGRIIRKLRNAGDSEKAALREELRKAIKRHFEAEQARLEQRLKELEDRIKQLREDLKQRATQPGKILEDRFERWMRAASEPRPAPRRRPAGAGPG